jgi:Regulator of chromosome condensation (RCC1) repeat
VTPQAVPGFTVSPQRKRVRIKKRRGGAVRFTFTALATRDTTAPGPVAGLQNTGRTSRSVSLSWTNPADADLVEIVVRRAEGGTAPGSPLTGAPVALGNSTADSVTDTGVAASTKFSYAVFAVDSSGNASPAANITVSTLAAALIDGGLGHSCGIDGTGTAFRWGADNTSQLGDGGTTPSNIPVAVDAAGVLAGKTLIGIGAGDNHSCALDDTGKAYC